MTIENDFLPFATSEGANVIDQADYVAAESSWVGLGFQNGLAVPQQLNKVWRQSSFVAAAIAAFMAQQTNSNVLDSGNLTSFLQQLTQAILQPPYVLVEEQQASGTSGGTFTSGAWQTRLLNTKVTDTQSIATLTSNQITLPAGLYVVHGNAVASAVAQHQTRLQNITGSATLLTGTSENCGTSGDESRSFIAGQFTLAVQSAIALQHRCNTTVASTGFGTACGFGQVETYSLLEIVKIG